MCMQKDENLQSSDSSKSSFKNQSKIDEFLKGSNGSFLNNEYSFKDSEMTPKNPEISCDNPLEMESMADSKKLEIGDLEVSNCYIICIVLNLILYRFILRKT